MRASQGTSPITLIAVTTPFLNFFFQASRSQKYALHIEQHIASLDKF